MPLTDYTFKLGDAGVVLNDDSASFPFVDILRVSGLANSEYRETYRDHEGTDGSFVDAEFERGRPVVLEGTAYCAIGSEETYMDTLKSNFAPVTSPIPFYFKATGVSERLLFVKPLGVRFDWDTLRRIGMTSIQFLMFAEDPRIYSSTLNSTVVNFGGEVGTGFGFDFGFDFGFGSSITPNGVNVVVGGNRPTPAVFTITGPVTNPTIINDTLGLTLQFIITLASLETLVVDLGNRTVFLNGTTNRRNTLVTPNWYLLSPGTSFIRFGGSSGSGTLTIAFRDAWR